MNYELVKELKDAGLEQVGWGHFICEHNQVEILCPNKCAEETYCYRPTLSELIDACGEEFNSLYRIEKGWAVAGGGRIFGAVRKGKTPSEAVARLWLALQ